MPHWKQWTYSEWTYSEWNEKLVTYVLGAGGCNDNTSVRRIPATPEELCVVAGAQQDRTEQVVECFRLAVCKELATENLSFLPYCLHYKKPACDWWRPTCSDPPYFFAMLWLTCLVAFGAFESDGDGDYGDTFDERLGRALGHALVGLSAISLGSFDDVWEDLAAWTRQPRADDEEQYRELVLPDPCPFRTRIGRPYYLAFPHRRDRDTLAAVLAELQLDTDDPPVRPVLLVLQEHRARFSRAFQADLENLFTWYLEQGKDPKDSPFWRAVRHAAAIVAGERTHSTDRGRPSRIAVLVELNDDDLYTPFLAMTEPRSEGEHEPPIEPLEIEVDGLTHRLDVGDDQLISVLSNPRAYLRPVDARAVAQGVVPLLEVATDLFRVGSGDELSACTAALVHEAVEADFRAAFAPTGAGEPSGVPGWRIFPSVALRQRDDLGGSLSSATILMVTTEPPSPTVYGGVRVHDSRFLAIPGYLPCVRAVGARDVAVEGTDRILACSRDDQDPTSWSLPPELAECPAGSRWIVRATYDVDILGHRVTRMGSTSFGLETLALSTAYKPPSSGSFHRETCSRQVTSLQGSGVEVPLGITARDPSHTLDTLSLDQTARWLGPGEGEMSLDRRCGYPWMVVGTLNSPEMLVLVADDLASAAGPDTRSSELKGDKRHWRLAFGDQPRVVWHREGCWVDFDDWIGEAKDLYKRYRHRAKNPLSPSQRTGTVAPTGLQKRMREEPWGDGTCAPGVDALQEVVAQLAANRAGLPLREFHDHLRRVLGLRGQGAGSRARHLTRALEESCAIDVLRRADGRQQVVFVRQPRLVAHRRAGRWKAALVGWLPPVVRDEVVECISTSTECTLDWQNSASPSVPSLPVVVSDRLGALSDLSTRAALPPVEFLDWPDIGTAPLWACVRDDIRTDVLFEDYQVDVRWCWTAGRFEPTPDDPGPIQVERMKHGIRVPVYRLVEDGRTVGWSHSRTWALLTAYERAGRPFLHRRTHGVLTVPGESPLHLPLPIARLCAIAGMGLPGPEISADGERVVAYDYPFGEQLLTLLRPHLPAPWTTV